jgi:hypothetical protein
MAAEQPLDLDFFAGGVPAGAIFQLNAREIKRLLAAKPEKAIGRTLEEVCFIGLVSFFEAFCRDCFASLINICPKLLVRLKSKNYDVSIDSLAALEMDSTLPYSIGFLVSERFDFGNSQKINALYSAVIGITPFSKDEMKTFDKVLADRNLLVHHGGIYTHSYFHQRIALPSEKTHPFMDSLIVDTDYVTSKFDFLYGIAEKIVKASHVAITKQISSGELSVGIPAQGALKMFTWWDEG